MLHARRFMLNRKPVHQSLIRSRTVHLHDRQTRKPSAHTTKAYRQDFLAIAGLVTGGRCKSH
jgi:hypothetical protein